MLFRSLVVDHPGVADFLGRLAESHSNLAGIVWNGNKLVEADGEYRQALAIYQRLVDDHPAVTEYRKRLADCRDALGSMLRGTGTTAEADVEMREALRIRKEPGRRLPRSYRVSQQPGGQPPRPSRPDDNLANASGRRGRVSPGSGALPEAG